MARDTFVGVGTCPRHPRHLGRKLIGRASAVGMAVTFDSGRLRKWADYGDWPGGMKTVQDALHTLAEIVAI